MALFLNPRKPVFNALSRTQRLRFTSCNVNFIYAMHFSIYKSELLVSYELLFIRNHSSDRLFQIVQIFCLSRCHCNHVNDRVLYVVTAWNFSFLS